MHVETTPGALSVLGRVAHGTQTTSPAALKTCACVLAQTHALEVDEYTAFGSLHVQVPAAVVPVAQAKHLTSAGTAAVDLPFS